MKRSLITSITLFLFFILTTATTCDEENFSPEQNWIVASEQKECQGIVLQQCYLIKINGSDQWEYYYDEIIGLDYEAGYEYQIRVREDMINNPPADASSIQYTLIEIISKEMKASEGLPD